MPNINFKNSDGTDLGNLLITKDYLMSVYPQIANQLITPELWIWGNGGFGGLGNNRSSTAFTPVTTLSGGANWKQVSSGNSNTTGNGFISAIKTDGTLWTWGRNSYGRLGDNTTTDRLTPVTTFAGGTNWKQVTCGGYYTAAIKTDGTLWTWGSNAYGQLGDNTQTNRSTPVTTFAGGTNWKQVSGGVHHTAAIKTDGTLWTWGRGNSGQIGNNVFNNCLTPVTTFLGGTNWKQVDGCLNHTAAIKTDGTLWTWGNNSYGRLGDNTTTLRQAPVTTFAGGTNWKQVACGNNHTSAIKTDGTLWTWGCNGTGQLGNNTLNASFTPVTTFVGGTNWKQVSLAYNSTAIKTDGTLWNWGYNSGGIYLAVNDTTTRSIPVTTFAGGTNWKQVDAGESSAAIKTSDDLQGI